MLTSNNNQFRMVRSGKQIFDKMGRPRQPMAEIATCKCGFEHAPFGTNIQGKREAFCGIKDGEFLCVGKGLK